MSFLDTIDQFINRTTKRNSYDRCAATANVSDYKFTTHDGGFISSFEFKGSMRFISQGDIAGFSKAIVNNMGDQFRSEGHTVSFYIDSTQEHANSYIEETLNQSNKSLKTYKLKSPIPEARKRNLKKLIRPFTVTVTITTEQQALNPLTRKNTVDNHYAQLKDSPQFKPSQDANTAVSELLTKHNAFVQGFQANIKKLCSMEAITCEDALNRAHDALYRMSARGMKKKFQMLPKEFSIRNTNSNRDDGLTAPSIAEQILNEDLMPHETDPTLVPVGSRIFAPAYILHNPHSRKPLSDLFTTLGDLPFRAAIHIKTGDASINATASQLTNRARNLKLFGGSNSQIYDAGKYLMQKLQAGDVGVNASFSFCTWGRNVTEALRNRDYLTSAVASWGGGNVHIEKADPMDSMLSVVPLFGTKSKTPPKHPWLLSDLTPLLPFTISCQLFDRSDLGMILPNQQPWSYEFGSPKVKSYSMLVAADSGSGKSSLLSNILNSLLFKPSIGGLLPPIGVIDNSKTQEYWAESILNGLPENLHYLVQCVTPKNTEEYCMNFFDLPLGLDMPAPNQLEFAQNYLYAFLSEPGITPPPSLANFCASLVREAYRVLASTEAKIYYPGDPVIDKALGSIDFVYSDTNPTTFRNVRDLLFKAGKIEAAYAAQSWAVPTILQLPSIIHNSTRLRDNFGGKEFYGENALQYAATTLSTLAEQYPALSGRSRLNWQASRIRIINLQLIAPKADPSDLQLVKTSGLFYGVAWQALFGEYFLLAEELKGLCPDLYMEFQMKRVTQLNTELKSAFVDEYHRASSLKAINTNVLSIEREGRARRIFGCFISQALTPDFPDEIIKMAASVFVLGLPDKEIVVKEYKKYLSYTDNQEADIRKHLSSPYTLPFGSSCLVYTEYKGGTALQLTYIPSPPEEVWQITTDTYERTLINEMKAYLPVREACVPLASKYGFGGASAIARYAGEKELPIAEACKELAVDINSERVKN